MTLIPSPSAIWMSVSVTGVAINLLLYPFNPSSSWQRVWLCSESLRHGRPSCREFSPPDPWSRDLRARRTPGVGPKTRCDSCAWLRITYRGIV